MISQIQGLQSGSLNDKEYEQSLDMLKREMSKNPHLNNTGDQTLNNMIKNKKVEKTSTFLLFLTIRINLHRITHKLR